MTTEDWISSRQLPDEGLPVEYECTGEGRHRGHFRGGEFVDEATGRRSSPMTVDKWRRIGA